MSRSYSGRFPVVVHSFVVTIFLLLLFGKISYSIAVGLDYNLRNILVVRELVADGPMPRESAFVNHCQDPSANSHSEFGNEQDVIGCLSLTYSKASCIDGNLTQSMVWFENARQSCHRYQHIREWAGLLAWAVGNRQQAADNWSQLPHSERYVANLVDLVDQQDFDTQRYLIETLILPGKQKLSLRQLEKVYAKLATTYAREEKWSEIVRLYQEAIQQAPKRTVRWIRLGNALRRDGQFTAAAEALEQAIDSLEGGDAFLLGWAYEELGIVYQKIGLREAAARSFSLAIHWFQLSSRVSDARLETIYLRLDKLIESND